MSSFVIIPHMKIAYQKWFLLLVLLFSGCTAIQESAKVVWGSSTRALEKVRPDALRLTVQATPKQCFDAVVAMVDRTAKDQEARALLTKEEKDPAATVTSQPSESMELEPISTLNVFIKDPRRNILVLMGIPGSINTTEVGVFFSPAEEGATLVEVASLSKRAKAKAAEMLFTELQKSFSVVSPKPRPAEPKVQNP